MCVYLEIEWCLNIEQNQRFNHFDAWMMMMILSFFRAVFLFCLSIGRMPISWWSQNPDRIYEIYCYSIICLRLCGYRYVDTLRAQLISMMILRMICWWLYGWMFFDAITILYHHSFPFCLSRDVLWHLTLLYCFVLRLKNVVYIFKFFQLTILDLQMIYIFHERLTLKEPEK